MTTPTAPGQLRRGIGVWGLAAAILNGMIGAGVFALAGSVAHFSGSWAPLVVLIVGLALLPVVLVFAALAGLFDETGGPILYVDAAFGPIAGFQTGWVQCLSTLASAAANANLLADYLLRVVPSWNGAIWHGAIVFAALGLALAINLLEARRSAVWLQRVSVGKLVPLAVLLALALPPITGSPSMLAAGEWSLPQAVLLSVYAFTGFEGALSIAGEAREPRRDFPRAMIGVFVAVAALYALPPWAMSRRPMPPARSTKPRC
ncbi:MAG: APC family permease [Proteobacteria bacterium]|nr:APC family permease [Pseudomonadota bacterium]